LNTRPTAEIDLQRLTKRSGAASRAPRSRLAARLERVLNAALNAEPGVVLNATAAEILNEPSQVGAVVAAVLDRAGPGLTGQRRIAEAFRRAGVSDDLLDALVSPDPVTRASAARLCGSLRLGEAVIWIEDLLQDSDPMVRDAAVRALAELGGRRAIEALMGSVNRIALHRLAISIARGATDIDIEALMRQPGSEKAATVTVLACGLRRDALRVAPLLGIAHDRRWPVQVRIAACRSLGMIGDPTAVGGLDILAEKDPDPGVKKAAAQAWRRLQVPKSLRPA
jgi:HEAT repeat protein